MDHNNMSLLSSITLSLSIILSGYLSARCSAAPRPPSTRQQQYQADRTYFIFRVLQKSGSSVLLFSIYHACLILLYWHLDGSYLRTFCPHPENFSENLLSWSSVTTISIIAIVIGAFIRLSAFANLGQNFTFYLSPPDRLVTSGMYRYMQHPSYTGFLLALAGILGLFWRWNGAVGACWVEPRMLERVSGWGIPLALGFWSLELIIVAIRVKDEEGMLKQTFGKEWEQWNARTARFIFGVW